MALSTYLANKLLDHWHGRTAYAMPTTYLALYTSSPGASGTAITNEATYTSYARVAIGTGGGSILSAAAGGSTSNPGTITFPANTGSAQSIAAIGIVDSSSGVGNLLAFSVFATPITYSTSQVPTFAVSAITDTMS